MMWKGEFSMMTGMQGVGGGGKFSEFVICFISAYILSKSKYFVQNYWMIV